MEQASISVSARSHSTSRVEQRARRQKLAEVILGKPVVNDRDLAAQYGVSYDTVQRVRQKLAEKKPEVQKSSALQARAQIAHLLTSGLSLSDSAIASDVGCSRSTVLRVRKQLETEGSAIALTDGRSRNRRASRHEEFWKLIDDMKVKYGTWGGRQMFMHCITELAMNPDEIPSISRIEGYLSAKGMVGVKTTAKTDRKPYYMEDYKKPMVRVGMDVQTIAPDASGDSVAVISCIDFYTRAVYCEVLPYTHQEAHYLGLSSARFTNVFVKFCQAFGVPDVLVLDNGQGQITTNGGLPAIARFALSIGVRVEWEPYGRPWRNGAVENWHRHSQRWWESVRLSCKTVPECQRAWRQHAWRYTSVWPQRKFGNQSAAAMLEICNPWPFDQDADAIYQQDIVEVGNLEPGGIISMQRMVETGGYVKLHGNDFMHVPGMMIGGYVRIDFVLGGHGQPGMGTVYSGKGEVVMTFKHRFACKKKKGQALTYDFLGQRYELEGDERVKFFDQASYNRDQEKWHKNPRSRNDYTQTGTTPGVYSRKAQGLDIRA